jgi:hypothetical protein
MHCQALALNVKQGRQNQLACIICQYARALHMNGYAVVEQASDIGLNMQCIVPKLVDRVIVQRVAVQDVGQQLVKPDLFWSEVETR